MANTYLDRTFTAGDPDKWTWSAWVKQGIYGVYNPLFSGYVDSDNFTRLTFTDSDTFNISHLVGGSWVSRHISNRVFRDPAAWYHIVAVWDTGNASEYERQKLYINGVEENSWSTETNCAQDTDSWMNTTASTSYCRTGNVDSDYFKGVMAHVHYADGQAYAPTVFGETDSTSGIWVPISAPSVTYGTNGFFLKYASGALGTDSSGEGNNMTVNGTLINTKDNAMNNFCTANPLDNYYASITYTNGNTTATSSTPYGYSRATQGVSAGLWYWEVKATTIPASDYVTGVASTMSTSATDYPGKNAGSWSYVATDGDSKNDGTETSYGDTYSAGDIIGVYLDLTANKLYFAKNGTIQNSGTGISITAPASTDDGVYAATAGVWSATTGTVSDFNFGNGYFGTTAVTSAVADAGGEGQFEYDPSAGTFDGSSKDFRALCTNNIATYG